MIGYFFWFSSRPIEVIAVHEDGNYSFVLVKKFPITDKGLSGYYVFWFISFFMSAIEVSSFSDKRAIMINHPVNNIILR
ncbi:DUF943 family protein, partial [Pantoea agglomerans]|uniref:DUF943 family protein n=1 Tax=Enterobacter agglomerans TaxID=549 RepID=UPI003F6E15CC